MDGMVAALRHGTKELHRQAERTGVVAAQLRGTATRQGYALYLRNLFPAYREMERGLERHRAFPSIRPLASRALYRTAALSADLEDVGGARWECDLPLLSAGRRYGDHIRALGETDGRLLVAHAYVRYFGDLSGGQILKRLLTRSLGLEPSSLRFYGFPEIADLADFKQELSTALDGAATDEVPVALLLEEALRSFTFNIEISEAVQTAVSGGPLSQAAWASPDSSDDASWRKTHVT